jgi:hypothetical protein
MTDERNLEQRDAPQASLAPGPAAEGRQLSRVVAEAALGEQRIENAEVTLKARSAPADDLVRPERKRTRMRREHESVELPELAPPVVRRPLPNVPVVRRAKVPVVMRSDLVSLTVCGRDLGQRPADDVGRRREADVRRAASMPRWFIRLVMRPVEEVDAADKEREVRMRAPRNAAPVGPELNTA